MNTKDQFLAAAKAAGVHVRAYDDVEVDGLHAAAVALIRALHKRDTASQAKLESMRLADFANLGAEEGEWRF